eukprot:3354980-Prymnesium_polylepis.1
MCIRDRCETGSGLDEPSGGVSESRFDRGTMEHVSNGAVADAVNCAMLHRSSHVDVLAQPSSALYLQVGQTGDEDGRFGALEFPDSKAD